MRTDDLTLPPTGPLCSGLAETLANVIDALEEAQDRIKSLERQLEQTKEMTTDEHDN